MDKVLVSWSIPNLITINLMAWIGIIILILLYQLWAKQSNKAPANNSGGY